MPEAVPAWRCSIAFITVVVKGATLIAIPSPNTRTAGNKVVRPPDHRESKDNNSMKGSNAAPTAVGE
jgi:hypothetical protein